MHYKSNFYKKGLKFIEFESLVEMMGLEPMSANLHLQASTIIFLDLISLSQRPKENGFAPAS